MEKQEKRKMILISLLLIIGGIIVYILIPYSPVKKEYWKEVNQLTLEYGEESSKRKITEDDLKALPHVLQNYFIKNGYVGVESASVIVLDFNDVDFALGTNESIIKIDYQIHTFAKEPTRVAFIDSQMYGIPFQGIDMTKRGSGSMKGVIAKHITLFNTSFDFIDSAYLAECLMHPSLALQQYISYRELDKYSVEATIRINETEVTGIFYFNENYEMISFVDEKRFNSNTDNYEKWSAIPSDYKVVNGINRPTRFQAVWHYSTGDFIYFDGAGMDITYK